MADRYDSIYLSPHLDDAVLSAGGQIHQETAAGNRVLVVTVFAGDPPPDAPLGPLARDLHRLWRLGDDAVRARRDEDRAALARLGAGCLHWDLPECIYRRDPAGGAPLYPRIQALFRPPRAEDRVAVEIARRLATLPPALRLVAPLGVGHHVDHILTRDAALGHPGEVSFYEDFPYVRLWFALGRARRALPAGVRLEPEVVPLSEDALRAKCEAIAGYDSQVVLLLGGGSRPERAVRRAARRTGGERIWRRLGP
jgi:LmbE family N-acetylglucosaminyl deacetylase